MSEINEILNFNFSPTALQQSAKNSIYANITRLYDDRINKLLKIKDLVGESEYKEPPHSTIQQVFKKFKIIINKGGLIIENFDKRELKTLTYSLSHSERSTPQIFSNPIEIDIVLKTLEIHWKDSYIIGLVDCYLKNWESNHPKSLEMLGKFIFNKLKKYEGSRTVLKSLKANMKFFDERNGDVTLGSELAIKNKHINKATNYLSLPESWFSYSYFSKVILAYYVKRQNNIPQFIDELNEALYKHNNSKSNKRLISKLVVQANKKEFGALQDKVKSMAIKFVGDPSITSYWNSFENATEKEKEDLKLARIILNDWITRQFINVFFEKCINDPRRKEFWLNYTKHIIQFKVVGSRQTFKDLLNDTRIRNIYIDDDLQNNKKDIENLNKFMEDRYAFTNSKFDRNAALIFIMKNHLFIEFSDEGAFYAYKLSNKNAPSINQQSFESITELKTPTMRMLVYRTGNEVNEINDEGRLAHNDGELKWEDVVAFWIKEKLNINV